MINREHDFINLRRFNVRDTVASKSCLLSPPLRSIPYGVVANNQSERYQKIGVNRNSDVTTLNEGECQNLSERVYETMLLLLLFQRGFGTYLKRVLVRRRIFDL